MFRVVTKYGKWCLHHVVPTPCSFPNAEVFYHIYFELSSSVEMSKLGLLSAGFSAILGKEVVLQEGGATFSIHDVFKQTYEVMKPPGFRPPSPEPVFETFLIYVKGLGFRFRSFFGLGYELRLRRFLFRLWTSL